MENENRYIAEGIELLERRVPFYSEDVGWELPPVGGGGEVCVGREDAEVIKVVGGAAVVAVGVLELTEIVEGGYLIESELTDEENGKITSRRRRKGGRTL
jgi:hypothetical protein